MKLLVTGSHGLVGQGLSLLLAQKYTLLCPSRDELDILNPIQIGEYLATYTPDIIVHSAAFVNAQEAEKERGNLSGVCYQTNVVATKTIVDSGVKLGIPTIYISTGSVFHGSYTHPGPFQEIDTPITMAEENNWYGYTKYLSEQTKPACIIRISHPVVPDGLRIKDDYVHKLLTLYAKKQLFPLFPDQLFPLTYLPDLATTIERLIDQQKQGIFHVASPDMVSPYTLMLYLLKITKQPVDPTLVKQSILEFYANGNSPLRFAQYSALSSSITEQALALSFHTWKETIDASVTF